MASPRLRKARRAARIAAAAGNLPAPVAEAAPLAEEAPVTVTEEEVCEQDPCEEEVCETHPAPKATKKATKKAKKASAKSSD